MFKYIVLVLSILLSSTVSAKAKMVTLSSTNTVILRDEVSVDSVSKIILQLTKMKSDVIYIYLNSPGGNIVEGFRLMNTIKVLQESGKNVVCIADYAASMAFSILQSCTTRLIIENGIIMQHQAAISLVGQMTRVREDLRMSELLVEKLNKGDADRLKMSLKDFKNRINDDWWMFDKEAIDNKAADAVTLVKCDLSLANTIYVDIYKSVYGAVTVTWSSCPLVYVPISITAQVNAGVDPILMLQWMTTLPLNQTWKEQRAAK